MNKEKTLWEMEAKMKRGVERDSAAAGSYYQLEAIAIGIKFLVENHREKANDSYDKFSQ